MSPTVIQVDNLWKKYSLGVVGTGTLRHDLNRWWHRVRGKADPYAIVGHHAGPQNNGTIGQQHQASPPAEQNLGSNGNGSLSFVVSGHVVGNEVVLGPVVSEAAANGPSALAGDEIWALQGVSFEVKQGEILGIIGPNGAGKSTLLKILSRVTAPTSGVVRVNGRIASLLEVGTGFHQELTGKENIFLNGTILGMTKREVDRKFDEIVDFAGVERFLHTPIKRYSSGMQVRLAFAVAAHLDPEILIIDEVLAVGDIEFQKKCLGKMGDVVKEGRTILFVSHNLAAVESLCSHCFLLKDGKISLEGTPRKVVDQYLAYNVEVDNGERDLTFHPNRTKQSATIMTRVTLESEMGAPSSCVRMGESLAVHVDFLSSLLPLQPVLGIVITNQHESPIFGVNNRFIPGYNFDHPVSLGRITCYLNDLPLMPGAYLLDLYFGNQQTDLDVILKATSFEVIPKDVFMAGAPPASVGPIFWSATWSLESSNHDRPSRI